MAVVNDRRSKRSKSSPKREAGATFKLIRTDSKENPFSYSPIPHFFVEAVRRKVLIPTDIMVAVEVMAWLQGDVEGWVYNDGISAKTGLDVRSVNRSVKRLSHCGFFVLGKNPKNPKARRKIIIAWRKPGFALPWEGGESLTRMPASEANSSDTDVTLEPDIPVSLRVTRTSSNREPIENPGKKSESAYSVTLHGTERSSIQSEEDPSQEDAIADQGDPMGHLRGVLKKLTDAKFRRHGPLINREADNLRVMLGDEPSNLGCNQRQLWDVAKGRVLPCEFMDLLGLALKERVENPAAFFEAGMEKLRRRQEEPTVSDGPDPSLSPQSRKLYDYIIQMTTDADYPDGRADIARDVQLTADNWIEQGHHYFMIHSAFEKAIDKGVHLNGKDAVWNYAKKAMIGAIEDWNALRLPDCPG